MKSILTSIACVVVTACGGGGAEVDAGGAGGSADARVPSLAGACPLAERVGLFSIFTRDDRGTEYGGIEGKVYDAVLPVTVLEPLDSEAGCVLLRKSNPFCDPPCDGTSTTCDHSGSCVPVPKLRSAGEVAISGVPQVTTLTPRSDKQYFDSMVPNPPFVPGDGVFLDAAGDELAAFSLQGYGVEPLAVDNKQWTITAGAPLELQWQASSGPGRILATFNVDQHGNSPVTMHCDWEDTGTGTVPASLVDAFISYGHSGVASGDLYRLTVDSVLIAQGCVELRVQSHLRAYLSLDGVMSHR